MIELVYERTDGTEASIVFDAGLREAHSAEAQITEHPVDEGVAITDHVRPKLRRLQLQVHVTNTPIRQPVSLAGGAVLNLSNTEISVLEHERYAITAKIAKGPSLSARIGFDEEGFRASLSGGLSEFAVPAIVVPNREVVPLRTHKFDREFDRVKLVYQTLVEHRAKGTLFRVLTSLEDYERMAIKRVSTPRSVEDGDAATITLSMKEIRTGRVEVLENAPEPAVRAGASTRNRGKKPATEPTEEQASQDESAVESSTLHDLIF